jgi:hypothetical protein
MSDNISECPKDVAIKVTQRGSGRVRSKEPEVVLVQIPSTIYELFLLPLPHSRNIKLKD